METVDKSMQAQASSAHSRINIPLNLDNWRGLDQELQGDLLWFHQHLLDRKLTLKEAAEALDYDESVVFRMLKGTYEGSWKNIQGSIRSYKRLDAERGTIQRNEFVENSMTRLIFGALNYAVANNSITLIIGESRMGKTTAAGAWRDLNNHGRSVLVTVPAIGGSKGLLRRIAEAVGVNKNHSVPQMYEAIVRAFNRNRILILDEAHRLLPGDRRGNPTNLEIIRDLHDMSKCAVALLATQRFDDELKKSHYQFEQLLGRIGMPVRLPRTIRQGDFKPILEQYVPRPTEKLLEVCGRIANEMGRLGILVETLKVASRMAHKKGEKVTESHVLAATALRRQMMGEVVFAAKEGH